MKTTAILCAYVASLLCLVTADTLPAETLAKVTKKVYLDIEIDDEPIGRVIFGLFGDVAPKSAANFAQLCDGSAGFSY